MVKNDDESELSNTILLLQLEMIVVVLDCKNGKLAGLEDRKKNSRRTKTV